MQLRIALLAGLFLSATLIGCGGTNIPTPPANAKGGAPSNADAAAKLDAKIAAEAKAKKK